MERQATERVAGFAQPTGEAGDGWLRFPHPAPQRHRLAEHGQQVGVPWVLAMLGEQLQEHGALLAAGQPRGESRQTQVGVAGVAAELRLLQEG